MSIKKNVTILDLKKVRKLTGKVLKLVTKKKLNKYEVMQLASNLMLSLGNFLENGAAQSKSPEAIREMYNQNPSAGNAFMCFGLDIADWMKLLEEEK
jgi:hypothetical protein